MLAFHLEEIAVDEDAISHIVWVDYKHEHHAVKHAGHN